MAPSPPGLPRTVKFGGFELDRSANKLFKGGTPIKLAPQPFKVLLLLLDRHGQVVSRGEIQRHLWGESTFVDFERGINFSINQIRGALCDDAEKPRYIETLPKLGYRFVAEVIDDAGGEPRVRVARSVASESDLSDLSGHEAISGAAAAAVDTPVESILVSRRRRRWRDMALWGTMIFAVAGGAWRFARHGHSG